MATRPPNYTLIDRTASNIEAAYAKSPLNLTGLQPGQKIPSKIHNTLWLLDGLWQTYLDYNSLRSGDYVAALDQQWSTVKLAYTIGASIVVGAGSAALNTPVYYFDGYRIEVDATLLAPAAADPLLLPLATLPGRVWIYLSTANMVDPLLPFAEIRLESVAAGSAEAPGANEIALVGVDVDAAGLVTANTYPGSEPAFELVFGTISQRWTRPVEFDDTAQFDSTSTFNGIPTVNTTLVVASGALVGINASNSDAANHTAMIANAAGPGMSVTGVDANYALAISNTGAGASILAVKLVAGVALYADAVTGGGTAIRAEGGAVGLDVESASGLAIDARSATGTAIRATATGSGTAINGVGGPSAASLAGSFTATNTGAIALRGATAAAALSTAVAVQGTASGASTALQGSSGDGYAVVASGDATTPMRSALRLVPQDDDPTTPLQGDVLFNSTRIGTTLGRLRVYTSLWESVHASPKGRVDAFGVVASGVIGGGAGSGNLSLTSITAEQVGDVLVSATGTIAFVVDSGQCTVTVVDATSAVTLATSIERSIDTDAVGTNSRSFSVRGVRTLPDTAARIFVVVITSTTGAITYSNVIVSVTGVQ